MLISQANARQTASRQNLWPNVRVQAESPAWANEPAAQTVDKQAQARIDQKREAGLADCGRPPAASIARTRADERRSGAGTGESTGACAGRCIGGARGAVRARRAAARWRDAVGARGAACPCITRSSKAHWACQSYVALSKVGQLRVVGEDVPLHAVSPATANGPLTQAATYVAQ